MVTSIHSSKVIYKIEAASMSRPVTKQVLNKNGLIMDLLMIMA